MCRVADVGRSLPVTSGPAVPAFVEPDLLVQRPLQFFIVPARPSFFARRSFLPTFPPYPFLPFLDVSSTLFRSRRLDSLRRLLPSCSSASFDGSRNCTHSKAEGKSNRCSWQAARSNNR